MRQDGVKRHPDADWPMGKNWKNYYTDFAIHHVTCTAHQWQSILLYPPILSILYSDINRFLPRWQIALYGYVIMPEHFHLLVSAQLGENVRSFIHGMRRSVSGKARRLIECPDDTIIEYCNLKQIDLNIFYSKTAGKSDFRFWKEKPRVFPLTKIEEVAKKLDYIHNNPVRRGLTASPDRWNYSSFQFHYSNKRSNDSLTMPQDVGNLPS